MLQPGTHRRLRGLRDPLLYLLAAWLLSRVLLVIFCIEGVRFHPEETYIGAAASFWRRHLTMLPPHAYQYTPYEGGSLWVNAITGGFQAVMGESLWSLKATAVLLGAFGFAAAYRFTEWLAGTAAACGAGALMLLPPANILVEELKTDGLHYDSTGFLFVGVLAMGTLTAQARPSARRLLITGLVLGVCLNFSYQCFPAFAAAGLAWYLARDGSGGLLRGAKDAAAIGAGILVGIGPHLLNRALLNAPLFGLYGADAKDAAAAAPLPLWRVPQRFIEVIWLGSYHEAEFLRPLPLAITDIRWLGPVILGSLATLAVLHRRAFVECLEGLLPGRRASLGAAFGVPWLVLYPFAYTLATDLNPPSFPWHFYPLYPLLAVALGVLVGSIATLQSRRAALALGAAVGLAWTPVLLAHARGTSVPTDLAGHPGRALSRGASDVHFARFLIWNWVPRAESPADVRDALLSRDYDLRPELLAMLGHSLRGRAPEGLDAPLTGWDRASYFRGLRLGELRPLVVTPSKPNEWPPPQREAPPSSDACATAGLAVANGILEGRKQHRGGDGPWHWFGRGMAVGEKLDKDRTNAIFQGRPSPYGAAAAIADDAGERRADYLRGLGYALGRGGVLAQHRALATELSEEDHAALFEGIAWMRRTHFSEGTATIARSYFSARAEAGFTAGRTSWTRLEACGGPVPPDPVSQ